MKKLFILFAFLAFTGSAFSQVELWNGQGVFHNIAPGYISGDSVHSIGFVDMQLSPRGDAGGLQYADSIQVVIENADSIRVSLFIVPNQSSAIATESIADSVAVVKSVAAAGGGIWTQKTADGTILFPWHNIVAAITQANLGANSYRIYVTVFAVGSEVASSGKKFRTYVNRFY